MITVKRIYVEGEGWANVQVIDDIDVAQCFDNIVNLAWEGAKRTQAHTKKPLTLPEAKAIIDSIKIELTNLNELLSL